MSPNPADRIAGRDLLLLALAAGLAAGLVHLAALLVRWKLFGQFTFASQDVVWMAPLGYVLVMLALAVPGLALVAVRSDIRLGKVVAFALLLVASWGMLVHLTPIHPWATMAVAVGLATRAVAAVFQNPARWRLRVRRATAVLLAATVAAGAGSLALEVRRERRLMDRMPPRDDRATPNVLIVLLDTVRAASMSLHGYGRETTPNVDRLAPSSAVFDHAMSASPWTLPSHATLFTGRWPGELSAGWESALDGKEQTLAEALTQAGFVTGAFVANPWYTTRESGIGRGFARYPGPHRRTLKQVMWSTTLTQVSWVRDALASRSLPSGLGNPKRWRWVPSEQAFHRKWAPEVTDEFLAWQAGVGRRPFAAFLNYFDAHDPYQPPEPWRHRFAEAPDEQDAYDGGIALIDHEVGRLLAVLEQRGVLDRTIVVVTSDHGEQFGEHGLDSHGNSLYLQVLHVPLLIRYPPKVPGGVRPVQPVSLRDLGATLLELAGLTGLPWPGRSFAALAQGRPVAAPDSPVLLAEVEASPAGQAQGKPREPTARGPMRAVFVDRWHYIRDGDGVQELYDYWADREELTDLSHEPWAASVVLSLASRAPRP